MDVGEDEENKERLRRTMGRAFSRTNQKTASEATLNPADGDAITNEAHVTIRGEQGSSVETTHQSQMSPNMTINSREKEPLTSNLRVTSPGDSRPPGMDLEGESPSINHQLRSVWGLRSHRPVAILTKTRARQKS